MIGLPWGVGQKVGFAKEIGIGREALAHVLRTQQLSMDSNQRSYAWEKENVTEIFQDLQNAISQGDAEYFLGSIVTTSEGHIVDGQQRLATTVILLAAMRDYFISANDTGRANDIETTYLFTKHFRTQEKVARLSLNQRDNDFFKKYVLSLPDSPERHVKPDKNRDSHRRIMDAAVIAKERIRQIIDPFGQQQQADKLADWIDYLDKSARVIWINVPDDANAYTIFETLNDRGVDLSIADLLKVNIFNVADDRLKEAEAMWNAMLGALESVGGEKLIKTYIRHLWIAMNGPTRERELLTKIKGSLGSKQSSIDLANELQESAKYYSALLNPKHPQWNTKDTVQHLVWDLNELGIEQVRPLLLAIVRRFDPKDVELSLRSLVAWSVRFLIFGGLGGGVLEKRYGQRAKDIWTAKIKNFKELLDDIAPVIPTDAEFESAFANARVSQSYLARFYLRAMEIHVAGGDPVMVPNDDAEKVSLEHVLPENPSAAWGVTVDAETAEANYKKLGNLALLASTVNVGIGNKTFDTKKPFLATSDLRLTSEIAQFAIWSPEEIAGRQKNLAKIAVKTWPIRP